MNKLLTLIAFVSLSSISYCQEYTDYIGAGHSAGITVTSSSESSDSPAINTINGKGMDVRIFETGRFLSQATMGANIELINTVADMDYGTWIDDQMNETATYLRPAVTEVWEELLDTIGARGFEDPENVFGPSMPQLHNAWGQNVMSGNDLLRQKVAYALSQILVISTNSDLSGEIIAMADFYDIFVENAFGNYRDILSDVSLHASMGYYLSHLNNPKAIPEENVHPDENYAREIMQLFSIGLYELNNDGTQVLDANSNAIPTYDNADIKEMAKIFTGLGGGAINDNVTWTDEPYFGLGIYGIDMTVPLAMYEDWHELGEKVILKTDTIPSGQTGMEDIQDAIDILFEHDNVGPFLSYRLIQRLVKSNPSPSYVDRVASVFNDNGSGVRGDLGATVKAILMDEEARDGSYMFELNASRLREPLMRRMQLAKGIAITEEPGARIWLPYDWSNSLKQQVMNSPTVFNFYLPNHQPVGDIATNNLVAPEFKIHDTATGINYFNSARSWTSSWGGILDAGYGFWDPDYVYPNGDTGRWYPYYFPVAEIDIEAYRSYASDENLDLLINELDKVLTYGQLSDEMRAQLRTNLLGIQWTGYDWEAERIRTAVYLIITSPDYAVIR